MDLSPQDQLLEALLDRDITLFCELLKREDVNPNHRYEKPHYSTCLEIACRRIGCDEFVRALLQYVKPNINQIHPEPIHHAAKRGHYEALKILLDDKRTKVNAVDSSGRSALHFAVKEFGKGGLEDSEIRSEKCVELVMRHQDVNINLPNNKNFTPTFEAAFQGGKKAVEAMLKYAKMFDKSIELDGNTGMGKTARAVITEKYPELEHQLPSTRRSGFYE
ncbi:hypothetical protein L9F63_000773 [Diploptera punctata]|uniref:Uncharacterized protein n=1 Tax=Diploptera punctata TaxID=6984 RepID=A0AAD8AKZ0_DIPPU|nr:hypothetical protein L9F63_000773 [Diploptera punctata]